MRVGGARIAIGIAVVVLVAGCSAILGLQDNLQYTPNPSSGDGGVDGAPEAGGDGALLSCADGGGVCRPSEATWTGPLLLYSGPGSPGCPGGTLLSFSGKSLLDVPDAGCGCGCTSSCPAAVDTVFYTDVGCSTPCGTGSVSAQTCTPVSCTAATGVFAAFDAGAVCTATANAIPPPTEENVVACDPVAIGGGCPAGFGCYANPPPSPFSYCVSTPAVTTCPSDYPAALATAYLRFEDTRACSCTCTPPSSGDCSLTLADSIDCAPDATVAATACTPLLAGGSADAGLQIVDASAPGPCTPAGGLTGGVAPVGSPTQFCCAR